MIGTKSVSFTDLELCNDRLCDCDCGSWASCWNLLQLLNTSVTDTLTRPLSVF